MTWQAPALGRKLICRPYKVLIDDHLNGIAVLILEVLLFKAALLDLNLTTPRDRAWVVTPTTLEELDNFGIRGFRSWGGPSGVAVARSEPAVGLMVIEDVLLARLPFWLG